MKARFAFQLLVSIGSFFGIITEVLAENEPLRTNSQPLVAISGTDSPVKEPFFLRVTTANDWTRIWARHLGTSTDDSYRPLFDVDFDRCMVVVIFLGERIQTRRIEIESVSEKRDSIAIRFWEIGYGIHLGHNDRRPPPERPYAFIVLPMANKEIVLEEKIWSKEEAARDVPPRWKERARLKPTQTVSKKLLRKS